MTHFHYKENQLFCEETPVREIAKSSARRSIYIAGSS